MDASANVFRLRLDAFTDKVREILSARVDRRKEWLRSSGYSLPLSEAIRPNELLTLRPRLKDADIIAVDPPIAFYLFYSQNTRSLVFMKEDEETGIFAVPSVFPVPIQYHPKYWYNAIEALQYVEIVPLREQLGDLGESNVYLGFPHTGLTGFQEQNMVLPFVVKDKIYYAMDEKDFDRGMAETSPQEFLLDVLDGNAIRVVEESQTGIDPNQIISITQINVD